MKTLKISLVATVAAILAWQLHMPHKLWPGHQQLADFLMALTLCVVLQFIWTNSKSEN